MAERLYGRHFDEGRQALTSILKDALRELEVSPKILGVTRTGWVQVEIEGPDSEVAEALIGRTIGIVPTRLADLRECVDCKGRIAGAKGGMGLLVNVGIEEPEVLYALLGVEGLRRQLADGKGLGVKELANLYGLHEGVPLEVHVSNLETKARKIELELSDHQLRTLFDWKGLGLDRVLVVGATTRAARRAVKMARCDRDVLRVERLGVLENAIVCKMGTDAPGIIHAIGGALPQARLCAFPGGHPRAL